MTRIVNTQLLGWVNMDHVSLVTPAEWWDSPSGEGGFLRACVYMIMRNEPFILFSDHVDKKPETGVKCDESDAFHDKWKDFLMQWRNNQ